DLLHPFAPESMHVMPPAWIQAAPSESSLATELRLEWEALVGIALPALLELAGRVLAIVVLAWIAFRVLGILLRRIEHSVGENAAGTITVQEQRVKTLVSLVRSMGVVVILVITLFMLLNAIG